MGNSWRRTAVDPIDLAQDEKNRVPIPTELPGRGYLKHVRFRMAEVVWLDFGVETRLRKGWNFRMGSLRSLNEGGTTVV